MANQPQPYQGVNMFPLSRTQKVPKPNLVRVSLETPFFRVNAPVSCLPWRYVLCPAYFPCTCHSTTLLLTFRFSMLTWEMESSALSWE